MFDGQLRIAAVVPQVRPGDISCNTAEILRLYYESAAAGASLVLFPELSVTGYSCGDLFLRDDFVERAKGVLEELAEATNRFSAAMVVGLPLRYRNALYDTAVVLSQGRIAGFVAKCVQALTAGEERWFTGWEESRETEGFFYQGEEIPLGSRLLFQAGDGERQVDFAVLVGEEVPLKLAGTAQIILQPGARLDRAGGAQERRLQQKAFSARRHCWLVRCGAGVWESSGEGIYDGHALMAADGEILSDNRRENQISREATVTYGDFVPRWLSYRRRVCGFFPVEEEDAVVSLPNFETVQDECSALPLHREPFLPVEAKERERACFEILQIQAQALATRVERTGSRRLVLGISGGLDSTLALVVASLCCDILDKERNFLLAVTMPGMGTTSRTKSNAVRIAENLGAEIREISIRNSVLQHFKDIDHDPKNLNVVYENSQARERTQILMDIANEMGGLVIGTGDMSEIALGWSTYNGDQMSMYSLNCGVPKTVIYHLLRTAASMKGLACEQGDAKELSEALLDVNATPVSPELLPGGTGTQKTEKILGDYLLHDFILYYFVKYGESQENLLAMLTAVFGGDYGGEELTRALETFLRRFRTQQFKRNASADGPQVLDFDLSARNGWQMPADLPAGI